MEQGEPDNAKYYDGGVGMIEVWENTLYQLGFTTLYFTDISKKDEGEWEFFR